MQHSINHRLHTREISELPLRTKSHRHFYGDRSFIDNLDIVNELGGHSGCVNALSWSKSGKLLASGSDDQHLHIHTYQPEDTNEQFKFTTTVATGHTANIFSVKFMPHSNDRTVITAAGDSEVRVFDLEYAGQSRAPSQASANAADGRRSRRGNIYDGVRYLSDGDTDSRVYRSHGDRVKRIVTESSPHLFLTCSEDGEVRQWDLRQPSSAYPAPRGGRFSSRTDESLPAPLISYKRYQLDLNSISCSASQPHYIALGGAHLHAFLHDRRMTGRDRLKEAGKPLAASNRMSADQEELMNQATQCVRKFAPDGQKNASRTTANGHITALKISDARPNEMIVSWSGDHIYSFDLVQPSGQGDGYTTETTSKDRKRKRRTTASETSLSQTTARPSSRPRTGATKHGGGGTALRVRYQNGQSEDLPLSEEMTPEQQSGDTTLNMTEMGPYRIAKAMTTIRSSLFGAQFSSALGSAAAILSDIDEDMRDWRYPMEPDFSTVRLQQTLRLNRESVRRFVQAAGTLARLLGGKLQTPSGSSPLLAGFTNIDVRSNDLLLNQKEQFGYDFIKAIILWLESGIGRLIEGFTRPEEISPTSKAGRRLPVPAADSSTEAIDEYLIPYLLRMADNKPVTNFEANRFEVDQNTQLFTTEQAAVLAFAQAVKIPFADLSSAVVLAEGAEYIQSQDRQTAIRFWGAKAARGLLLNAAEGVNYSFTSYAFGGLGERVFGNDESSVGPVSEHDEEEAIAGVETLDSDANAVDGANADDIAVARRTMDASDDEITQRHERTASADAQTMHITMDDDENDDEDDDDHDETNDESDHDDDNGSDESESSEASEEDGVPTAGLPRYMYASAYERRRLREKVAPDVPCSAALRSYKGHSNSRTVKDCSYFGLNDEYVVSGSDDGNVFLWDRKTSELVNILSGDGEVVNVAQGHPYEPILAVSGIDHTIKVPFVSPFMVLS